MVCLISNRVQCYSSIHRKPWKVFYTDQRRLFYLLHQQSRASHCMNHILIRVIQWVLSHSVVILHNTIKCLVCMSVIKGRSGWILFLVIPTMPRSSSYLISSHIQWKCWSITFITCLNRKRNLQQCIQILYLNLPIFFFKNTLFIDLKGRITEQREREREGERTSSSIRRDLLPRWSHGWDRSRPNTGTPCKSPEHLGHLLPFTQVH